MLTKPTKQINIPIFNAHSLRNKLINSFAIAVTETVGGYGKQ